MRRQVGPSEHVAKDFGSFGIAGGGRCKASGRFAAQRVRLRLAPFPAIVFKSESSVMFFTADFLQWTCSTREKSREEDPRPAFETSQMGT